MTTDDVVKVLDSLTKLVGAVAWPVLVGFVLVRFRPVLGKFFEDLGELSVKGAGFEASAKRIKTEAAAALMAASAKSEPARSAKQVAREAHEIVADAVTPAFLRKAGKSTILWVDDHPGNNAYERQSMEALGITFVLATSTDDALDKIKRYHFDAIISDMGRPPDAKAGYTLLESLRKAGDTTPFIIYASSDAPEHKAEAHRRGALGSTNRPSELFAYVLEGLRSRETIRQDRAA
jgi:CheY-like chemotaxis protein